MTNNLYPSSPHILLLSYQYNKTQNHPSLFMTFSKVKKKKNNSSYDKPGKHMLQGENSL